MTSAILVVDLAGYSERYLLLTEMGHVDYTSYALIEDRPAMLEYWEAAKPGDVGRYEAVAQVHGQVVSCVLRSG